MSKNSIVPDIPKADKLSDFAKYEMREKLGIK